MTKREADNASKLTGAKTQSPDLLRTFDGAPQLQRSRSHWQLGDWNGLAALDDDTLEQHQERAKLALLAASGFAQKGDKDRMEHNLRRAVQWGCDSDLVNRVLLSGLLNGLGRASALLTTDEDANARFEEAIHAVTPEADVRLLARARGIQERVNLGLLPESLSLLEDQLAQDDLVVNREKLSQLEQNVALFRAALSQKTLTAPDLAKAAVAPDTAATNLLQSCIEDGGDLISVLRERAEPLDDIDKCLLYIAASDHLSSSDPMIAIDALVTATDALPTGYPDLRLALTHRLLALGMPEQALTGLIEDIVGVPGLFSQKERDLLLATLKDGSGSQKEGHGHVVLMAALRGLGAAKPKSKQLLVEVGTTREHVRNQGSTSQLAMLCKELNLQFVTVDMDPFNTERAQAYFDENNLPFEAVNAKGEDYLAAFKGKIHYAFLDAYDFDHGKHSERRQSRYEEFLGSRIEEEQCHKMHLDCAVSLVDKLAAKGLICIDDTWQDEDGNWTAKGTLAVPYLLENGFEIVDARNRAVLLRRRGKKKR